MGGRQPPSGGGVDDLGSGHGGFGWLSRWVTWLAYLPRAGGRLFWDLSGLGVVESREVEESWVRWFRPQRGRGGNVMRSRGHVGEYVVGI